MRLALTGRGLLDFLAGVPEHSDEDLEAALEIFGRHDDVESMALAHSFYAEQAAVLGRPRRGRGGATAVLDFYLAVPDTTFVVATRSYSRAKLASLNGDLDEAERHYRAATAGFGRLDRPVMNSMCLGMVADFDERAGDFPAAIKALEAAIATNEELLGGFTGALLARARLGAAAKRPVGTRGGGLRTRARLGGAGCNTPPSCSARSPASPRCTGSMAATPPRPRPPTRRWRSTGPAARGGSATASITSPTCTPPPRCVASSSPRSRPKTATPSGRQRCSGRPSASARTPASTSRPFQHDDVERAQDTAASALGEAAFSAAFERGRAADQVVPAG